MTLQEKLESGMAARRAELINMPLARIWGELAKACNEIYETEALAAFQRYKENKWLDVPDYTLNELLHLIQTREYERGYKDGESSGYADWTMALEDEFSLSNLTGPQDFCGKMNDSLAEQLARVK